MYLLAEKSQITPDALNRLFEAASSGLPVVSEVEMSEIAGGYGYLSKSFRLRLKWTGAGAESAPPTLVAKLPLPERLGETIPSSRRMYRREAMFHRVVAPEAPIRTAKAWASVVDEASGLATLVFEDLGGFDTFEDDETVSVERVERSVMQLARLHARYWNSGELESMDWLAYPAQTGVDQVPAERFAKLWPQLVASGAYELSSTQLQLGELLSERMDGVYEALHAGPMSLIHADLHQENLFFDDDEPVFIDWASAERANPAKDIAKLTASCLEPGTVGTLRPEMVRAYLGELRRRSPGVGMTAGEMERFVHLAMCHYLAMMTFLSDSPDFDALAANVETRTDFTSSRVITACDSEEIVAAVEGV